MTDFCHMRGNVDKMCTMSGKLFRAVLLLLLATVLPSCTFFHGTTDVLISSTPAGAAVFLDGQDTGETTPIRLDMGNSMFVGGYFGKDHDITVQKKGFQAETRRVYHHTSHYTSSWIHGATDWVTIPVPFFWTTGDWFMPLAVKWEYSPHELHIKLYPTGKAPGEGR
jgi:hypothetical protein